MADFAPKVIALEHIELVGLPVIDGVPTVANDNVLAAGQADPAHNGIYRVSTTNPGGVWFPAPRPGVPGVYSECSEGRTHRERRGTRAGDPRQHR